MKVQYVVQVRSTRTGWGWELYRPTREAALELYAANLKDGSFRGVRVWKETIYADGRIKAEDVTN